jgi:hypothetical protein
VGEIGAVDLPAYLREVTDASKGVHPRGVGAGPEGDENPRLLPDRPQAPLLLGAADAPLHEGDVEGAAPSRHDLPEFHDIDELEEFQKPVLEVEDG